MPWVEWAAIKMPGESLGAAWLNGRAGTAFGRSDVKFPVATTAMVGPHPHDAQKNVDKLLTGEWVNNLTTTAWAGLSDREKSLHQKHRRSTFDPFFNYLRFQNAVDASLRVIPSLIEYKMISRYS